ncbi:MAG: CBS domain-containing protein [Planctomycetota bacterium]|jgi:CBS domain-containing protein
MKVKTIMTPEIASCRPEDSMHAAARLMWDNDCGAVPVVDSASGQLTGIVTDRDMCMAALLSNRPAHMIPVADVMSSEVCTCHEGDDLRTVHATMRANQIRRLPVVDDEKHLVGLVSLNDLAVEAFGSRSAAAVRRQKDVAKTLSVVSEHSYDLEDKSESEQAESF